MIPIFFLAASLSLVHALPQSINVQPHASTFAGETVTALFPPPGASVTATDTFFLDGSEVGFPGPTPSTNIFIDFRRFECLITSSSSWRRIECDSNGAGYSQDGQHVPSRSAHH